MLVAGAGRREELAGGARKNTNLRLLTSSDGGAKEACVCFTIICTSPITTGVSRRKYHRRTAARAFQAQASPSRPPIRHPRQTGGHK